MKRIEASSTNIEKNRPSMNTTIDEKKQQSYFNEYKHTNDIKGIELEDYKGKFPKWANEDLINWVNELNLTNFETKGRSKAKDNIIYYCIEPEKSKSLYLSGLDLTTLPESILVHFSSLILIDLSNNLLEFIPNKFIHNFVNLTSLDFSNNSLEELPSSIDNLNNLIELLVESNKLKKISSNIFKLPKLEILNLSNNLLESLEDINEISTSLKTLELSHNNFKSIPITLIKKLFNRQLYVLNLSNNYLCKLPLEQLKNCLTENNLHSKIILGKNQFNDNIKADIENFIRKERLNIKVVCEDTTYKRYNLTITHHKILRKRLEENKKK